MRLNKYLSLALGTGAVAATVLATPLFADNDAAKKYDAAIKLAMASKDSASVLNAMTCESSERGTNMIRVLAKSTDKGARAQSYLSKNGGKINSRHGDILSITLPYGALKGLAKLDTISHVEASQKMSRTNDIAANAEVGTGLSNILATCSAYNGSGVVVGIIDSGVDTTLDAFKDENGKSRISYYWNMALNDKTRYPTVITPEGDSRTYSYGTEYTSADIEAQDSKSPVCDDKDGHGTHVAGTIGGRDKNFPGMAPKCNFIVVTNEGAIESGDMWRGEGTGATLDGFEYVISRAKEMGMPLVVNMSQGTAMGPHDGSTLFEQAIQSDIEERGLILCVASGNEAAQGKSAEVTIPAGGSETINLLAPYSNANYMAALYGVIDIWSDGNPKLDIKLEAMGNTREIAADETIDDFEEFGILQLACSKEVNSENGDSHAMIALLNEDSTSGACTAKLTFTNNSSEDAKVNLYLQRNTTAKFNDHVSPATLSMPGTTPGAITCGAYTTRDTIGNYVIPDLNIGEITNFSGRGPVRKNDRYTGLNATKPDIVAPGQFLISQLSTGYRDIAKATTPKMVIDDTHVAMQGTSMATPVVTGTVALILQSMPNATAEQIKDILFSNAISDDATGSVPNDVYGNGKLNAASVDSDKIVSPQPTITNATMSKDDSADLVITGKNFTPSMDVYINGELWDSSLIELKDSTTIIVHKVFVDDSPIAVDGIVNVETVKVVNRHADPKANSSEIKVGEKSGKDIASLSSGSGGCFIATAAYGSYMEPEVMALRRFRDRDLMTNAPGRKFVDLYYTYSPPVAAFISEHPTARFATRLALTPMVYSVNHPGAALALALALGLGGCAAYRRRRKDA